MHRRDDEADEGDRERQPVRAQVAEQAAPRARRRSRGPRGRRRPRRSGRARTGSGSLMPDDWRLWTRYDPPWGANRPAVNVRAGERVVDRDVEPDVDRDRQPAATASATAIRRRSARPGPGCVVRHGDHGVDPAGQSPTAAGMRPRRDAVRVGVGGRVDRRPACQTGHPIGPAPGRRPSGAPGACREPRAPSR